MKTIKIVLAVLAVIAVIVGVIFGVSALKGPEAVQGPENQFTKDIALRIDAIRSKDHVSFRDDYEAIMYCIESYAKDTLLGSTRHDLLGNTNNRASYERLLYGTFTDKYLEQVKNRLNKSWNSSDIKGVSSEISKLKKDGQQNGWLSPGSESEKTMKTISRVIDKYNSIHKFITECSELTGSSSFPVGDAKQKMDQAHHYLANDMTEAYIKNCSSLKSDLENVPSILFKAHVKYLESKVNHNKGKYKTMSYGDYMNNVISQLNSELSALSSSTYGSAYSSSSYSKIDKSISSAATEAYNYYFFD